MRNLGVLPQGHRRRSRVRCPKFTRLATVSMDVVAANQAVWEMIVNGDYLYVAHHTAGISIYDISSIASGVVTYVRTVRARDESGTIVATPVTDLVILGNTLYACARSINFATPDEGLFMSFDLSVDASNPTWLDTYKPTNISDTYPNWYQGLATDGIDIVAASQFEGCTIVSGSSPSSLTVLGVQNTPQGGWETSQVAVYNGHGYFANHGYGLRILDLSNKASPGGVTDRVIPAPTYNGQNLRLRNVVCDNNWLFASNNTITAETVGTERGLLALDISSPTTIPTDGSTWIHERIWPQDVDTWNNYGDKPLLGIKKHGYYVYLSNGQRGIAIFYVKDPSNPIYCGLQGTGTASETNLYTMHIFQYNGHDYAIYADGLEPTQKYNMYIDRVTY